METLQIIIVDNIWNNVDFWHVAFMTIILSFIVLKTFSFLDKNIGIFNDDKNYDLAIYKKSETFFPEKDVEILLKDLQENHRCKKSSLQQMGDFDSLMSSSSNSYKNEILQKHICELLTHISDLKRFLAVNFSEETVGESINNPLVLLPDVIEDLSDNKKQEIYSMEDELKDKAIKIFMEKKDFYFQKERELKDLVQKTQSEYDSYRFIVKKYLHV